MKKLLTSTLIGLVGAVVFPAASTFAATGTTNVFGTVTGGGSPISGANVSVECNGNIQTDSTDADGGYLVQYTLTECPNGETANVSATKGSNSGSNSGKVNKQNSKLNVAMVDVNIALPEMGVVTGGIATLGAGGALLLTRRKRADQSQN